LYRWKLSYCLYSLFDFNRKTYLFLNIDVIYSNHSIPILENQPILENNEITWLTIYQALLNGKTKITWNNLELFNNVINSIKLCKNSQKYIDTNKPPLDGLKISFIDNELTVDLFCGRHKINLSCQFIDLNHKKDSYLQKSIDKLNNISIITHN